MEKKIIHTYELHLLNMEEVHQEIEKMVNAIGLEAGKTHSFDLYKVIETYLSDPSKRKKMNDLLGIIDNTYDPNDGFGVC